MKRALLLSYHVPPRTGIASVRIGQMMDGLTGFGWEVIPVTPDLGDVHYDGSVVTTGVVDFRAPVRRLLGVAGRQTTSARLGIEHGSVHHKATLRAKAFEMGFQVINYANRQFGWTAPGTKAAAEVLAREPFDVVVSSSPPESTHHVASRVHGAIPWVADLRDPWTGDGMCVKNGALGAMDRILEPRVLRGASALTTVSEPLAEALRSRYPGMPVYCIPNAFNRRDWVHVPFVHPPQATFLYAGQLYAGKRDPRPLFTAIADVLRAGLASAEELSFDFYGDGDPWLAQEIRRYGISAVVHAHRALPREDILHLERSASRLLLFLWNDPRERGTYTGKFFEYLGARRPILAIGGPDQTVVDDALMETGAGDRVRSVKAIRDAIVHAVMEWRCGATATVPEQAANAYESRYLAQRFAQVFESLSCVAR